MSPVTFIIYLKFLLGNIVYLHTYVILCLKFGCYCIFEVEVVFLHGPNKNNNFPLLASFKTNLRVEISNGQKNWQYFKKLV